MHKTMAINATKDAGILYIYSILVCKKGKGVRKGKLKM